MSVTLLCIKKVNKIQTKYLYTIIMSCIASIDNLHTNGLYY